MRKCKYCGKWFKLNKANRYEIPKTKGIGEILNNSADEAYECFDCPKCGCQNLINIRMVKIESTI